MSNNGGFTLIELILVTVIIGILAGMVVVNYGGYVSDSKIQAAKGDITMYGTAIDLYVISNNDIYPQTLANLMTPTRNYVKDIVNDPWGNPYNYVPATSAKKGDYQVFSSGVDGEPGTDDDVTSSSVHE
jgi:general secretion pathway protein G